MCTYARYKLPPWALAQTARASAGHPTSALHTLNNSMYSNRHLFNQALTQPGCPSTAALDENGLIGLG